MHLTWDDLQTVEALVRTGTIVAAAEALGLRHTSISRRIDTIERRLEEPLFLRGARLQPTALARSIAEQAAQMAQRARDIDDMIARHRRIRQDRLAVTTNDVLAPLVFGAIAQADLGRLVEVRVTDEEAALEPGLTDLALRPGARPAGALGVWRLGRLRVGIYRAAGVGDDAPWILPAEALRERASMRWWKVVPKGARGALVACVSLLAMRDACVAGLGRAAIPAALAREDERLVLIEEVPGGPPVWLLSAATRSSDRTVRVIAERLAASIRGAPGIWVERAS